MLSEFMLSIAPLELASKLLNEASRPYESEKLVDCLSTVAATSLMCMI